MTDTGKYVDAEGILTHFHEDGKGENLLLIHGSGPGVSAWANWRLVFPVLSQHFHLYAPDVVGFGYTKRPEDNRYSVDMWIGHMIAFIETLELQPVSIIGNSMGGGLALHLAHRRPDLINKIILMGSVGISFPLTEGLDAVWGYTPGLENMKRLIQIFSYDQTMAENNDLVEIRYQASIQPGLQEAFTSMFPEPRQQHVESLALGEEVLRSIDKPVLLVHGREDRVIPIEQTSWKLAQLLPNAEFHMFSHCGHWTQIEKTEPFCQLVTQFMR